jgi:putative ABC transport system ATP-binding protein
MNNSFILLQNLCKDYKTPAGCYHVLKDINLTVAEGEFVALMGPSGSGKSTLMNIVGCLDTPTCGKYYLDGQDVGALDNDAQALIRNKTIGFIFQGFNLLPRANLENNVALPMIYAGATKTERKSRAKTLLEKVGLGTRFDALPNQISGGEQQRVAIARALSNNPKLILADEPTGNLDSKTSNEIMKLFVELNKEGITIFLVTHERDVADYARRLISLKDGNIISDEKQPGIT